MISRTMESLVLNILMMMVIVTGSKYSDTPDTKIDKLLKKLNKPALKSIKSPDGDIIDCIHIKNHPIYDHPLLKNHTIQMRPSYVPQGWKEKSALNQKQNLATQLWTINGKCPKNSIPIIRTRREDILRTKSIESYGKKDTKSIPQRKPRNSSSNPIHEIHEHAIMKLKGKFHGTRAFINVWSPYVQVPREFSLAQLWIIAGPISELNTIEAGWMVFQGHFRDENPRYFIYWTTDAYESTGCYNNECEGFMNINKNFALGAAVANVSTLNGRQYDIPTSIWKDPKTGNWWLKFHEHIVGYWPYELFNHLQNGADEINWGGEIADYRDMGRHTMTNMGSGRFAEAGYRRASYFRNIQVSDEHDIIKKPVGGSPVMTQKNCYNVKAGYDEHWRNYFYYGGPGRNNKCI